MSKDNKEDAIELNKYSYIARLLVATHILLEILYISVNCAPMIYINILSILTHLAALYLMKRGRVNAAIVTMMLEVYFHVIFAAYFMGYDCGFTFWYYGLYCAIYMPAIKSDMSPLLHRLLRMLGVVIIITYLLYIYVARHGILISSYNVSSDVTNALLYINAAVGFLSIFAYTTAYTINMTNENAVLHGMATHDYLTGLYNRQRLQKKIFWERYDKENDKYLEMSVAIMDIDFFKDVNDTYGHMAGDYVLQEIARILLRFSGNGINVGRWGGEEFMIAASDNVSYDEFVNLLERIRTKIEDYDFYFEDKNIKLTVSIGAAHIGNVDEAKPYIKLADERLYKAKNSGRNRVISE